MKHLGEIDNVIRANLPAFRKAGAMTVRPGYKLKGGWITTEPAIVVTVTKKRTDVSPEHAIPSRVGGYSTDVREATHLQLLRQADPAAHSRVLARVRSEFRPPEFSGERDVATGEPLPPLPPATATKPSIPYTPAPDASLDALTDEMSITCVASPDAGWPVLRDFLGGVNQRLTIGLYDFTSAHVLEAVISALGGDRKLSLVLDHPPKNATADQTDEETKAALARALGARDAFAWAAEARDPFVSEGVFPNAYHIKVAVRDGQALWLSSGNWNNSNQPDIDPWTDPATAAKVAARSDRDWHIVVRHAGLARTFEAYLKHDLEVAAQVQAPPKPAVAEDPRVMEPEPRILPDAAPSEYFHPLDIVNAKVTVQPVLTPDSGRGNYCADILQLVQSATQKLYIQTQYVHPPAPGQDGAFQALIDAVKAKMDDGLDVRIILSQYEATGGYLEKLQEAGWDMSMVRIQSGVHNKGFVIDSSVVAIGSQNWSGDGVLRNRDATLILHHAGAAQYFERIFLHDWEHLARQRIAAEILRLPGRRPRALRIG